jgi:hypothetical protein
MNEHHSMTTADCWNEFAEWLDEWREKHPTDDREDLELVDEFTATGEKDNE